MAKEPTIVNLSAPLLDSWVRAAHKKMSEAKRILPGRVEKLPSLEWMRTYVSFLPGKIKSNSSGALVGDNSFLNDEETRQIIFSVLGQDSQIKRQHSAFIPITAICLTLALRGGFEVDYQAEPIRKRQSQSEPGPR